MGNELKARFESIIKPVFPEDAAYSWGPDEEEMVVLISWPLNSDPDRPSKRSRPIRLVITREFLEDNRDPAQRKEMLADFVQKEIERFDPNHNEPIGQDPQPVLWVLRSS